MFLLLISGLPYTENLMVVETSAANVMQVDLGYAETIAANYYNKADNFNFEEYLSTHFTSSPTIDLIEIGMNDATLVAPGFISDLESNVIFNAAYGAWEVSTFIGNPGETVEKLLNRELYYETILFRLLNSSIDSDNAIDWLNQGAVKHSLEFAKSLTDAADWDYSYDVSNRTYLADLSDEELDYLNGLANNYVSGKAYTIIGDGLTFVENAMSISSSVEEFSGRIGSYLQLANLSESTIDFLKILKSNTSNNLLSKALDTVIAVSNESFVDFMEAAAKAGAVSLGKSAIKSFIGSKWKTLLVSKLSSGILSSGYTVVNGVLIANSLGQAISNVCFSTSKKLDHYELLKALVETESVIKSTVSSMLTSYTSGTMLSTALDLLYDMYALDCDLCIDLVNIMDGDWIQLSTTAQRNEAKSNINTVKNYYSTQYQKILPKKGTCGDNLYWLFDNMTHELIILGSGKMDDYSKESSPWYEYKDSIFNIHISSLCSQIGTYAFYGLSNLGSTIVFTDITKNNVVFKDGCFDSINSNVSFIFTEDVNINLISTEIDSIYALKSLYCFDDITLQNLWAKTDLNVYGMINILAGGSLNTPTYNSSEGYIVANENATINIYGDAKIIGRDHNPFTDPSTYYNALKLYSGASLNIYGNARFCSGKFYVYSGANINIMGNCDIDGGGISQGTYFYNYGDMFIDGKLSVDGGYCSDSVFMIYGTVIMSDFNSSNGSGMAVGVTCLTGKAYITDETVSHDLSNFVMKGSASYLSVHGKASFINAYYGQVVYGDIGDGPCVGTIELYGDAYFAEAGEKGLTVKLSGNSVQIIDGYDGSLSAGTFIINNTQGVVFDDEVTSLKLFNHKQNSFTLKSENNIFQDYDNDGLLDNIDPYPLDPLDGHNNTDFVVTMANSNLTITGYTGNDSHLIIPDSINGYNVTSVSYTFDGCSFESVTLGANVSNLSSTAFNKATTINFFDVSSENNTFISDNGVLYTKDTEKLIKYPNGKNDETYSILDGVKTINSNAFFNTKIKSIVLPDTLNTISSNAFSNCKIESVRIPEEVYSIGLNAFSGCSNLKTVYYDAINCSTTSIFFTSIFPSSVENFIIGENVETLPGYLLRNSSISEITIPANVKTINTNAFSNCNELKIKGYSNSCAKEFADSKGYSFIAITCGNCVCEDWQITTDSTCLEVGIKTGVCSTCGATMEGVVELKEHSYPNSWTVVLAPSCIENGLETRTCTTCNSATETRDTVALEHNFTSEWIIDAEATCTEEGSKSHHCSRCDKKSNVTIINKIAHSYRESVQEATCTKDGKKTYNCSACGDSYSEVITAKGHIDQNGDGKCDNCDYIYDNTCDHMCHKSGFMGFIWKIVRFFWKLFKMNPICECGVAHY